MKKKPAPSPPVPEDDPIEGYKAIGCLFVGICALAVIAAILDMIIDSIRF